jgi:circadian clock protein KaiC
VRAWRLIWHPCINTYATSWIVMTFDEVNKQRHRAIRILQSRGMAHSNRVRKYALTDHGLRISDTGG